MRSITEIEGWPHKCNSTPYNHGINDCLTALNNSLAKGELGWVPEEHELKEVIASIALGYLSDSQEEKMVKYILQLMKEGK